MITMPAIKHPAAIAMSVSGEPPVCRCVPRDIGPVPSGYIMLTVFAGA